MKPVTFMWGNVIFVLIVCVYVVLNHQYKDISNIKVTFSH